ncbi:hypothetical protein NKJ84_12500, partial [Mesorhizobium sp. M0048]|uniref:hypothetical protein n=1 Tax=Mesorhizobium sp. M0048 TaxID=2956860 RepID=UPI003336E48B
MEAETYGAAESVRTPTADRCCHEGRQKPSMARRAKLARVETGVVRNGRYPRVCLDRGHREQLCEDIANSLPSYRWLALRSMVWIFW